MVNRDRCGGALINRRHVVTAGHCLFTSKKSYEAGLGSKAYQIKVLLGEYEMHKHSEPLRSQQLGVEKIILHPYYHWKIQADRYDLAVLRLDAPVEYRPHILPICLPEKDVMPPVGTECMVSGWGATNPYSKARPKLLQAVDVKIIDSQKCEKWHRDAFIDV